MTIASKRHSANLLAGIQKNSLDTGLRRYDELTVESYLCGPVMSCCARAFAGMTKRVILAVFQQAGQTMQRE